MALFRSGEPVSLSGIVAGADLSAKQYYAVKFDSTEDQVVLAAAGEEVIGFLNNKPVSGAVADVIVAGSAKAILGGTVSQGDFLKSDANGKLVDADTDKDRYGAIALADGVLNDVIPVLPIQGYKAA